MTSGLLVREVWMGSSGEVAGVWPGDIVTAINGAPVVQVHDLRVLIVPAAEPFELTVQRGSRTLRLTLPVDAAEVVPAAEPAGAGLVLESPSRSYRIDSVVPRSSAAAAGIEPGDRLVRIDRTEPRSLEQVRRIVAATKPAPMLVEVVRGSRRLGIVVGPQGQQP
jgi:S1-C subfamily serine protease